MKKLFFLVLWLLAVTCFADQLIVEPDAGEAPILSLINNAHTSIQLSMYGLTDKALISALTEAKKNGDTVQVILDPHPYKAGNENVHAMTELNNASVDLQTPNPIFKYNHEKMLLADDQALIMTFNLTHSAFTSERNFGLLVTDPSIIKEIHTVFDADFAHTPAEVSHSHLVWSPNNSRKKIAELINGAEHSIQIYAQDLSDYQTLGLLAKAAKAGITVQIITSLDPQKYARKFTFLKNAGVQLHTNNHYYMHAKVMVIDNTRALIGSINFTQNSLNDNRELSVITEDKNVLKQLGEVFERDWDA